MKSHMLFKQKTMASAITVALMGCGYAGPALCQSVIKTDDAAKEKGAAIETVTVTAQGRSESILKVPYNISAVSGDDLQERNVVDQTELLRNVSGASVVDRGYRNSGVISGVTLRGLNVNGAALGDYQTSAVPTVSTYVNNTPIFANFLLKDLDRVEVLRGPQGTLYGSGSLGGTVRYITRRPELGVTSGRVDGGFSKSDGSGGNNWTTDVMFNVPVSDSVALRVVAGKVNNAGVIDYPNVYQLNASGNPVAPSGVLNPAAAYTSKKDADTVKIDYNRLSLLLKPNNQFSALLTYQTQSDDIGGRRQPTRGSDGNGMAYGKYENGSIQLEPSSRDVKLTSLEMDFDLGFATLSSGTSHYDQSGRSLSENTGFYAKAGWLAAYYNNYPRPMAQADRSYGDKAFVQEFRLVSKKGGAWDYVAGVYYQNQDLRATQYSYLRGYKAWADAAGFPAVNDNDFVYDRKQKFKETALFGELTHHFSQKLRVTGGARSFENDFSNDSILGSGVVAPANAPTTTSFKQKDSGTLFKGNISYDLSPTQMVYGTASEGYRRGGTNAVPLTGTYAENKAWQTFKPDSNINYELGIKGTGDKLRYNVSMFLIDWKNIQLDVATPNWGFFAAQNGGKARSQGLEVELDGRLGNAWHYGLGYSYVDAKLKENVYRADNPAIKTASAGTRLPGTASHTLSGSLAHTSFLDSGMYWTNRVSGYYQSSTENNISSHANFKKTWPGFSQWGLSSSLTSEKWSATLYVKNLFNSEGVTGGFLEQHMGTSPANGYMGNGSKVFISQPRTIGASLSYSF